MERLAKIAVITGKNAGREYALEERLVVGGSRDCPLVIPGLKGEVLAIEKIKGAYILKSLSGERVVVSEESVFEKMLIFGDRIKLGETELEFREGVPELDLNLSERDKNLLTIIIFVLAFLSLMVAFGSWKIAPVEEKKPTKKIAIMKSPISRPITVQEASDRFELAEHYYEESRLDSGNLYRALMLWKEIVESLEDITPKPPVYQRAKDRLNAVQEELDARLNYLKNNAFVAHQTGQADSMEKILRRIMRLVPEPTDKNYIWAKRKLIGAEKGK